MSKLFIIESATAEKIPFLRGVLVESLVRAGLSFQDAYLVAQSIRGNLEGYAENSAKNNAEITSNTLKELVLAEVQKRFGSSLAKSYEFGSSRERQIMVQTSTGEVPFSAGILSRSMQACAIDRTKALETAKQVHEFLQKGETTVIDHVALRAIVYERLKEHCSRSAADRFLSWRRFKESGIPLIVLVGGITGTGKSTLTTELAYQLNIVRTQSTDMMREIVRCYLPPTEIPTLSYSSFEAWRGLSEAGQSLPECSDAEVIRGFLSQYQVVKHGLEATIYRAVKENHDLIIDGVHVLPSKLELDIASYPHRFLSFKKLHFHFPVIGLSPLTLQHSIRRYEFDAWLLERSAAPIDIHKVQTIRQQGEEYIIDEQYRCSYLIGAGGTRCPVYRELFRKLSPRASKKQIVALEEEFPYDYRNSKCHLWIFDKQLPGYSWYVPKADGYINIGIGAMADKF